MKPKRLAFITNGGVIDQTYLDADRADEDGPPQTTGIQTEPRVEFQFDVVSILDQDSLDMTDQDRRLLRAKIEETPDSRIVLGICTAMSGRMLDPETSPRSSADGRLEEF